VIFFYKKFARCGNTTGEIVCATIFQAKKYWVKYLNVNVIPEAVILK
jgi:hypothetical protein